MPGSGVPHRRQAGTVRRTTTLDVLWPDGADGLTRFVGIGRDLLCGDDGVSTVVARDEVTVDVDPSSREVLSVKTSRKNGAQHVVGARVGCGVRGAMSEHMAEELRRGSPVVQLLDDLTGAWIVGGFALALWGLGNDSPGVEIGSRARRSMEGVCLGFAPGSSALALDGGVDHRYHSVVVEDLAVGDDAAKWHELPDRPGMSLRRARRMDVQLADAIEVNSMFQDSSTTPDGGRRAIHQYGVRASADREDLCLLRLSADPRILPYGECSMAALGLPALIGTPLRELRDLVPLALDGVKGCTHLNDAVRALSFAEQLAAPLLP